MCDRQCSKEGFEFHDIAAIMVEEHGEPHTMNICRACCNLRQAEGKEPEVSGKRRRIMVVEKSCRGKRSACQRAKGFQHKMWRMLRSQKGV